MIEVVEMIHWIKVVIGAFFEVLWVIGLKHSDSPLEWMGTAFAIALSFYFLINAGKFLPVGTVYITFVGLGTAGTVLSEFVFFNVPFSITKVFLILILLVGVMGLKKVSDGEVHSS